MKPMAKEDDIGPRIARRIIHILPAFIVTYYFLPNIVFGIHKLLILFFCFAVIPMSLEAVRLHKKIMIYGLREHEQDRVASYVWFLTGSVILIAIFPQQIAAPCIIAAAVGDPILGITRNMRRRYTISFSYIVIVCPFLLFNYYLSLELIFIAVIAAGIMLVSESVEVRVKWHLRPNLFYSRSKKKVSEYRKLFGIFLKTDDDLMMQLIPAIALAIIYFIIGWQYMPPVLIHVDPTILKYV